MPLSLRDLLPMLSLLALLVCICGASSAGVAYAPLPRDGSTPYQQRLAVYGPDGELSTTQLMRIPTDRKSRHCRLEYICPTEKELRRLRTLSRCAQFQSLHKLLGNIRDIAHVFAVRRPVRSEARDAILLQNHFHEFNDCLLSQPAPCRRPKRLFIRRGGGLGCLRRGRFHGERQRGPGFGEK